MRIAMFSTKPYDQAAFAAMAPASGHHVDYLEDRLRERTAGPAAR